MFRHFKYLLTQSCCLIFLNSFAQGITERDDISWSRPPEKRGNYIEGTRYLQDDFINGDVYYDGKLKFSHVPLRLNLHNDEFEYMENDSIFSFAEPYHIDKIVIENEVFIYLNRIFDADIAGFVKRWNSEFPFLLTKMKIVFFTSVTGLAFVESKPDRFERTADKHYLMQSENEIIKISSVKKLIKLLCDHSSELSKFAKEEKVSGGNGAELDKLLDYYHKLEQGL